MRRLWTQLLLLLMGGAALAWLAVGFDVYVVPWLATAREMLVLFARGMILRWLLRPLGRVLVLVLLVFGWKVQCKFCRRLQAWSAEKIALFQQWWRNLRLRYRLLLWTAVIGALSFTMWGIYLLLVFAPMFAPLVRRIHTWGLARAFAHWTRPSAQWFNRMIRKHPLLKRLAVLRTLRYWLVQKVRQRRVHREPET